MTDDTQARELAVLRREVAELRAALQPFAEAVNDIPDWMAGDDPLYDPMDYEMPVTIGHLRAARDVLARWDAGGAEGGDE